MKEELTLHVDLKFTREMSVEESLVQEARRSGVRHEMMRDLLSTFQAVFSRFQGDQPPGAATATAAGDGSGDVDPADGHADEDGDPATAGPTTWSGSAGDFYADAPDHGQHDTWKREALFAVWRFVHKPEGGAFQRAPFGLDNVSSSPVSLGPLFPLDSGLAEASRRLGFLRLFRAALGQMDGRESLTQAMLDTLPPGESAWEVAPMGEVILTSTRLGERLSPPGELCIDDLLRAFHRAAEAEMEAEGLRIHAANEEKASTWREPIPLKFDDLATWTGAHTLGSFDLGTATRPPNAQLGEVSAVTIDLAACPPLVPLTRDPSAPHVRGPTPSTAAPLPPTA